MISRSEKLRCDRCDFVTVRRAALVSHQQRRHGAPPVLRPRDPSKAIMRGEIELKLKCPFCDKQFERAARWKNHATTCPERKKSEQKFGKQLFLPAVTRVRPYYFKHEGRLVTFMSSMTSHAEAEQEFLAEVEVMKANGKRPAGVVTSRAVVAEMVEAGYLGK